MSFAYPAPLVPNISDPAALRRALDPMQTRRPLARLLGLDPRDLSVAVDRTHFSATRPTTLQYRVGAVSSAGDAIVLGELVGHRAEAHAAAERVRLSKSRRAQVSRGAAPALLADLELGLVFRTPGLDARLPGLKLLHDPALAAETAAEALGVGSRGLCATVSLRAHRLGKRAVLQIDLRGTDHRRLYARLRPTSSAAGAIAFRRHREIAAALAPAGAIAVPEPLRHNAALGAAFIAALPGAPSGYRGAEGIRATKIAGRALSALFAHGPECGASYGMAEELALLGGWIDRVCTAFPTLAGPASAALTAVEATLFRMPEVAPRPCHRDFHEGQILIHGDRAGVLDFDTYCRSDPALDTGNLIAHLRMRGLRENRRLTAIADAFRRAMLPHAGPENVKAWTRAALLRLGCIQAFTSQGPKLARALFREAAR